MGLAMERLEVRCRSDWSIRDQLSYVGAEFKRWVQGIPVYYKTNLAKIVHNGDHVVYHYEAVRAEK